MLFNIYINDLSNVGNGNKIFYADDAVFYFSCKSLNECLLNLNMCLNEISDWLSKNKLIPNINKTKLMLLTNRTVNNLPRVYFNGESLEWINQFKYLGIFIDSKLSFKPHVQYVQRKLNQLHGVFYSMNNYMPINTLIKLFHSLVYPTLIQSIIIWGGIYPSNLINIKISINKILRQVLNVKYSVQNIPLTPTIEMYKFLNVLTFDDIHKFFLLKFIHDIFYNNTTIFYKYFTPLLPTHNYGTRGIKINLPYARLDVVKHGTLFKCCELINNIDDSFLNPQSKFVLKKRFKMHCIDNY